MVPSGTRAPAATLRHGRMCGKPVAENYETAMPLTSTFEIGKLPPAELTGHSGSGSTVKDTFSIVCPFIDE